MKCPYCGKEMAEGYFRISNQDLCWTPKGKKANLFINKPYDYQVMLAKRSLIKFTYIKVWRCETCQMEVINEKNLEVSD